MANPVEISEKTSTLLGHIPSAIARIYEDRASRRALVALILLLNFLLYFIFWLADHILSRAGIISPTNFLMLVGVAFVGWFIAHAVLIVVWFAWREPPKIHPGEIGVLFVGQGEPECDEVIAHLYRQLKHDLAARGLSRVIVQSLLPEKYVVRTHIEAARLLEITGARLILYGDVQQGMIKGHTTKGFQQISFVVKHRPLTQQEILPFSKTIAAALALRSFSFSDSNSFIEKNIVVENMSEVSRFFIGAALALDGKIDESIPVIEELLHEVELKPLQRPREAIRKPQLDLFNKSIKDVLKYAYMRRLSIFYETQILDFITKRDIDPKMRQYEMMLDQIEKITPDKREWALTRAVVAFHFGNYREAHRFLKAAQAFLPNDPTPYISMAFLALWQGKYPSALKNYYKASRRREMDTSVVVGILRFFYAVMEAHPDKKQLRFGLAFVNEWFFDQYTARREYQLFLDETDDSQTNIKVLRDHAEIRLHQLPTL